MSLNFPLHTGSSASYQIGQNISEDNLNKLLKARCKEDLTTPVAYQAFKEYQKAQTGIGHHIRKYAASVTVYGTMIGAPVAGVIGGAYWLLKDYIAQPTTLISDLADAAIDAAINNTPMIGAGNPILGAVAEYTTPRSALAVIVSIGAVDAAFYRTVGVAPVASVAKWSVLMMSSALAFAAKQAGDMVARSYDSKEDENTKTREQAQKSMISQLTKTYDDIADGFLNQVEQAKDSPAAMQEYILVAEQLKKQFPLIRSELKNLGLAPSAVNLIMSRLVTVMDTVKHVAFDLRSPKGINADKYNTELLSVISVDEFASNAVPKDVKKHVDLAHNNTLGAMHTVKSYVAAGASGIASGALVTAALTAIAGATAHYAGMDSTCYSSPSLVNCDAQILGAGLSMLPGVVHGVNVASRVQNAYAKERKVADARKIENIDAALIKLMQTYDGIAGYLKQQYASAKNDANSMQMLVMNAESILAKIPTIKQEIADTGVIENSDVVTEELETVLAEILKESSQESRGFSFGFGSFFAQTPATV